MNADDKKIRALYRLGRQEHPSDLVDKRIKNAAYRVTMKRQRRWVWSLSTAAVIVLSFSVVLNVVETEIETTSIFPKSAPLPQGAHYDIAPIDIENSFAEDSSVTMRETKEFESQVATKLESRKHKIAKEKLEPTRKKANLKRMNASPGLSTLASPADSALALEEPSEYLSLPVLPTELKGLLLLDDSLTGDEVGNKIQVFYKDKKIIELIKYNSLVVFKAWKGAEIISLKVNWDMAISELKNCEVRRAKKICNLNKKVQAVLIEEKFEYIIWEQEVE